MIGTAEYFIKKLRKSTTSHAPSFFLVTKLTLTKLHTMYLECCTEFRLAFLYFMPVKLQDQLHSPEESNICF